MVSNFVAFARGALNDLRMLRDVFANHEKSCLDMISGKEIQQFRSQLVAGAIIKSHRDVGPCDMYRAECDIRVLRSVPAIFSGIWRDRRGFRAQVMRAHERDKTKQ